MHYDTVYSYYTMTYHHTEPEQWSGQKNWTGLQLTDSIRIKRQFKFLQNHVHIKWNAYVIFRLVKFIKSQHSGQIGILADKALLALHAVE